MADTSMQKDHATTERKIARTGWDFGIGCMKLRVGSISLLLLTVALGLPQLQAATPPPPDPMVIAHSGRFELAVRGPDSKPVPRASVEFQADTAPTAEQVQRGVFVAKTDSGVMLQTDADGSLLLDLPKKLRRFAVIIEQPGFGPYSACWSSAAHPETLPAKLVAELEAGWSVGGVVVDRQGAPIQGARIRPNVSFKKGHGNTWGLESGKILTTDTQGKWRYCSVPASQRAVSVKINHPDFEPKCPSLLRDRFEIRPGDQPVAKLEMQPGATVAGRVTDEAGNPISGAIVRAKSHHDLREAKTNDNGEYRLVHCEQAWARIVVSAKGRAMDMKNVKITPNMDSVDFRMKPGGKIRVRVLDLQGKPVPNASIFFHDWQEFYHDSEFAHVSRDTDANGVWQWNEAPLDQLYADISRPSGMQLSWQPLIARDEEEEYVFRLPAALVISGRVIDAKTREPIKAFQVIPGIPSRESYTTWARRESYLATNGQYRLHPDREGLVHQLRIEAEGYRCAVSREIKRDEESVRIDFELTKAENIAATVLTPEGQPASGAKVALGIVGSRIEITDGTINEGSTSAARCDTDDAGRFRFSCPETAYQIAITHPSGFARLKSSQQKIPNRIQLTAWARVEGTFHIGLQPAPNAYFPLATTSVHSYEPPRPMIRAFDVAWTDADGRFVFERVLPGDGFLGSGGASRVRADGVYENISLTEVPVTLSAGQTAHVDLNHWLRTVSGKLASPTGSKEKVPWKSAFITIRIDSSRPPAPEDFQGTPEQGKAWRAVLQAYEQRHFVISLFTANVDPDGSFCSVHLPPGNYVMDVQFKQRPPSHRSTYRFFVPPPIDIQQASQPLDLGTLVLEKD